MTHEEEKELQRITAKLREAPDDGAAMARVWRRIFEPRRPSTRLRLAIASAAILAVLGAAAAAVLLRPGGPDSDFVPVVMSENSPAGSAGTVRPVVPGTNNEAPAGATFVARGVARISVLAKSNLTVADNRSGLDIALDAGDARFEVERLRPRQRFSVRTPHALVRVKGTVFRLTVSAERTDLEVSEGEVIWTAAGDTRTVGAGGAVSSAPVSRESHVPALPGRAAEPTAARESNGIEAKRMETTVALKSPPKKNGKDAKPAPAYPAKEALTEARALMAQKKYAEAVTRLESAHATVDSRDDREDLLFVKGQIQLINLGRARDAVATFTEYLREYPSGTYVQEALFHVAEAYGRQDDYDHAAAWFARFVEESRDEGRRSAARYNVGALALRLKGDCEEALKWFGLALVIPPRDIEKKALSGAVQCHVRLHRREGLAELVERLEMAAPEDPVLDEAKKMLLP
ncbi:MAG: FecR domain-containing protein [Deltaproteobacteria bacterium]|nr:FecR domain-containing protein [Deltaproteobacteria bacterium]